MAVLFAGPEAKTNTRSCAARAARALISGSLADFLHEQSIEAAVRIIARNAGEAAVNDAADTINRERGFGDIRRDDDFAFVVTSDGGVLFVRGELPMQGQKNEAARFIGMSNGFDGLRDFE